MAHVFGGENSYGSVRPVDLRALFHLRHPDRRSAPRKASAGNRARFPDDGYPDSTRYKTIIGPAMRARNLATQRVEARIGAQILNKMTALGMPDSHMVG
jgi:hypothetical protein